ncbi:MAG TPA: sigma-70 region 4 domain-containing protein [Solirubrobacteraceae bacterium]|nr:sigma-70 region 4 domain-containing protein [Solirubrobacteraceae bacterium]
MDEVTAVCRRLLGDGEAAARCAGAGDPDAGREQRLAAALACCRSATAGADHVDSVQGDGLRSAVAGELRAAIAEVPERQREAMALRDVAGLSHAELAAVLGLEPAAALALLIRARLSLRGALRGEALGSDSCPEHERALRTITLRIDHEPVPEADDDWLVEHVGHCDGCRQAHATLLEAAACYRGWPS